MATAIPLALDGGIAVAIFQNFKKRKKELQKKAGSMPRCLKENWGYKNFSMYLFYQR